MHFVFDERALIRRALRRVRESGIVYSIVAMRIAANVPHDELNQTDAAIAVFKFSALPLTQRMSVE